MQYAAAPGAYVGLNQPRDSQIGYHFASIACGSKLLVSSIDVGAAQNHKLYRFERRLRFAPVDAATERARKGVEPVHQRGELARRQRLVRVAPRFGRTRMNFDQQ